MSAHDPILDGERPAIAAGLLVQAATRRQIEAALNAIPLAEMPDVVRANVQRRGGEQAVSAFERGFADGRLFIPEEQQ